MKKYLLVCLSALAVSALCASAADVKENYEKSCAKCHGADGKGQTKMGGKVGVKDFTDAKVQADLTDDKAFKAIKDGIKDGEKTRMKPTEGLSDDEMKALAAYIKKFKA